MGYTRYIDIDGTEYTVNDKKQFPLIKHTGLPSSNIHFSASIAIKYISESGDGDEKLGPTRFRFIACDLFDVVSKFGLVQNLVIDTDITKKYHPKLLKRALVTFYDTSAASAFETFIMNTNYENLVTSKVRSYEDIKRQYVSYPVKNAIFGNIIDENSVHVKFQSVLPLISNESKDIGLFIMNITESKFELHYKSTISKMEQEEQKEEETQLIIDPNQSPEEELKIEIEVNEGIESVQPQKLPSLPGIQQKPIHTAFKKGKAPDRELRRMIIPFSSIPANTGISVGYRPGIAPPPSSKRPATWRMIMHLRQFVQGDVNITPLELVNDFLMEIQKEKQASSFACKDDGISSNSPSMSLSPSTDEISFLIPIDPANAPTCFTSLPYKLKSRQSQAGETLTPKQFSLASIQHVPFIQCTHPSKPLLEGVEEIPDLFSMTNRSFAIHIGVSPSSVTSGDSSKDLNLLSIKNSGRSLENFVRKFVTRGLIPEPKNKTENIQNMDSTANEGVDSIKEEGSNDSEEQSILSSDFIKKLVIISYFLKKGDIRKMSWLNFPPHAKYSSQFSNPFKFVHQMSIHLLSSLPNKFFTKPPNILSFSSGIGCPVISRVFIEEEDLEGLVILAFRLANLKQDYLLWCKALAVMTSGKICPPLLNFVFAEMESLFKNTQGYVSRKIFMNDVLDMLGKNSHIFTSQSQLKSMVKNIQSSAMTKHAVVNLHLNHHAKLSESSKNKEEHIDRDLDLLANKQQQININLPKKSKIDAELLPEISLDDPYGFNALMSELNDYLPDISLPLENKIDDAKHIHKDSVTASEESSSQNQSFSSFLPHQRTANYPNSEATHSLSNLSENLFTSHENQNESLSSILHHTQMKELKRVKNPKSIRILVSPSRVIVTGPYYTNGNAAIRHFQKENELFCRVSFVNDGGGLEKFRPNGITCLPLIYRIQNALSDGIFLAGENLELLAYSSSQLRNSAAWFIRMDLSPYQVTVSLSRGMPSSLTEIFKPVSVLEDDIVLAQMIACDLSNRSLISDQVLDSVLKGNSTQNSNFSLESLMHLKQKIISLGSRKDPAKLSSLQQRLATIWNCDSRKCEVDTALLKGLIDFYVTGGLYSFNEFDFLLLRYVLLQSMRINKVRIRACGSFSLPSISIDNLPLLLGLDSTYEESHKKIGKVALRIGLLFSGTVPGLYTEESEARVLNDIERGPFNFTDGVGIISEDKAKAIAVKIGLSFTPSAFQIRWQGCKGMLAVWPRSVMKEVYAKHRCLDFKLQPKGSQEDVKSGVLPDKIHILIRKSMLKLSWNMFKFLDVCEYSRFLPMRFNRQVLIILETLGLSPAHIWKLSQLEDQRLGKVSDSPEAAIEMLKSVTFGSRSVVHVLKTILSNKFFMTEPFIKELITFLRRQLTWSLCYKTQVPVSQGANLFGVIDETDTLNEGEVFCCIELNEFGAESNFLEGSCFVTKCPALHPGDVRSFRAVGYSTRLAHLKNVVVFSSKGDRDAPNMMSGSDLDGDQYFICWDPQLQFTKNDEAAGFHIPNSDSFDSLVDADVKKENILVNEYEGLHFGSTKISEFMRKYFVEYMLHDSLGVIAVNHLAQSHNPAIYKKLKTRANVCIKLAELHAFAVDAAKTGMSVPIPAELRVTSWPDFMAHEEFKMRRSYISESLIGRIFRKFSKDNIGLAALDGNAPDKPEVLSVYHYAFDPLLVANLRIQMPADWPQYIIKAVRVFIRYVYPGTQSALRWIQTGHHPEGCTEECIGMFSYDVRYDSNELIIPVVIESPIFEVFAFSVAWIYSDETLSRQSELSDSILNSGDAIRNPIREKLKTIMSTDEEMPALQVLNLNSQYPPMKCLDLINITLESIISGVLPSEIGANFDKHKPVPLLMDLYPDVPPGKSFSCSSTGTYKVYLKQRKFLNSLVLRLPTLLNGEVVRVESHTGHFLHIKLLIPSLKKQRINGLGGSLKNALTDLNLSGNVDTTMGDYFVDDTSDESSYESDASTSSSSWADHLQDSDDNNFHEKGADSNTLKKNVGPAVALADGRSCILLFPLFVSHKFNTNRTNNSFKRTGSSTENGGMITDAIKHIWETLNKPYDIVLDVITAPAKASLSARRIATDDLEMRRRKNQMRALNSNTYPRRNDYIYENDHRKNQNPLRTAKFGSPVVYYIILSPNVDPIPIVKSLSIDHLWLADQVANFAENESVINWRDKYSRTLECVGGLTHEVVDSMVGTTLFQLQKSGIIRNGTELKRTIVDSQLQANVKRVSFESVDVARLVCLFYNPSVGNRERFVNSMQNSSYFQRLYIPADELDNIFEDDRSNKIKNLNNLNDKNAAKLSAECSILDWMKATGYAASALARTGTKIPGNFIVTSTLTNPVMEDKMQEKGVTYFKDLTNDEAAKTLGISLSDDLVFDASSPLSDERDVRQKNEQWWNNWGADLIEFVQSAYNMEDPSNGTIMVDLLAKFYNIQPLDLANVYKDTVWTIVSPEERLKIFAKLTGNISSMEAVKEELNKNPTVFSFVRLLPQVRELCEKKKDSKLDENNFNQKPDNHGVNKWTTEVVELPRKDRITSLTQKIQANRSSGIKSKDISSSVFLQTGSFKSLHSVLSNKEFDDLGLHSSVRAVIDQDLLVKGCDDKLHADFATNIVNRWCSFVTQTCRKFNIKSEAALITGQTTDAPVQKMKRISHLEEDLTAVLENEIGFLRTIRFFGVPTDDRLEERKRAAAVYIATIENAMKTNHLEFVKLLNEGMPCDDITCYALPFLIYLDTLIDSKNLAYNERRQFSASWAAYFRKLKEQDVQSGNWRRDKKLCMEI